jgi:hypothetical protein
MKAISAVAEASVKSTKNTFRTYAPVSVVEKDVFRTLTKRREGKKLAGAFDK